MGLNEITSVRGSKYLFILVSLVLLFAGTWTRLCADSARSGVNIDELEIREFYDSVHGPKVVVTNTGTVLAFGGYCRFYRRSEDKGKIWSLTLDVGNEGGGKVVINRETGDIFVACRKCEAE